MPKLHCDWQLLKLSDLLVHNIYKEKQLKDHSLLIQAANGDLDESGLDIIQESFF